MAKELHDIQADKQKRYQKSNWCQYYESATGDKDVGFVWNKKHRYRGALGLKRPSVQDNTDKLTLLLF